MTKKLSLLFSAMLLVACAGRNDESVGQNSQAVCAPEVCWPYYCTWPEDAGICYESCHGDYACNPAASCSESDTSCHPIEYDHECGAYAWNASTESCYSNCERNEQCATGLVCDEGECVTAGGSGAGGSGGSSAGGSGGSSAGGSGAGGGAAPVSVVGDFYPALGCFPTSGFIQASIPQPGITGLPFLGSLDVPQVFCPFVRHGGTSATVTVELTSAVDCWVTAETVNGWLDDSDTDTNPTSLGGNKYQFEVGDGAYLFAQCTLPSTAYLSGFNVVESP